MIIDAAYIVMRLGAGITATELATELELTPRHVRRLAKAGGWTPPKRKHTGPRTIKVVLDPETYAALERRHDLDDSLRGRRVEDTAAALLRMVADRDKLASERATAAQHRDIDDTGGHAWAAGYLDALVAGIERCK
jgi:hypothetical protein